VNVIVTPEQLEEGGGHDAQVPTGSLASEDSGDGNEAAHTVQEVIKCVFLSFLGDTMSNAFNFSDNPFAYGIR
jgi:hypothetical protein